MMILRSSPASPFGRKVKIAARVLGLFDRIEVVAADTMDPADVLRSQNPLGKIPALVLESGQVLYDSRVIVEYFDHLAPGVLYAPQAERFGILTLQALTDGILDAALLQVYEGRFRPAERHEGKWVQHQAEKVKRGLTVLEAAPPALVDRPNIGAVGLACALGYLDLRFQGAWREQNPRLVAWLADFSAKVPAFAETTPH